MEDLKTVVMQALAEVGVDHDDLDLMSEAIENRLRATFSISPKETGTLAARLNRAQAAILEGKDVSAELAAIADRLDEGIASSRPGAVSFEQMEARQRCLRKVRYLREVAVRQEHRRKVRELQERLRQQVSPEAWKTYLLIEECANDELWRLQELAEGASR